MVAMLMASLLNFLANAPPDETVAKFEERKLTFQATGESDAPAREVAYRLLKPARIEPGNSYPVVLFLHGAGERGDDNRIQLLYLPVLMAGEKNQERFPCFLIAPQCPTGKWWTSKAGSAAEIDVALAILDAVLAEFPIDRRRVYLTGLSMGGFGAWALATRFPERFAAVVPICGGGNPDQAEQLVKIPIWAVHGSRDPVVPVSTSRIMVEALKKAGGNPKYSELEGVGHDSWTPAYNDPQGVVPWMFEQVNDRIAAGE